MVMPSQARSEMRNQKRVLTFPLSGASKKAPFYKKRGASTSLNSTRGVASKSVCLKPIFFPIFAELLTTFPFRWSQSYFTSVTRATRSRRYFCTVLLFLLVNAQVIQITWYLRVSHVGGSYGGFLFCHKAFPVKRQQSKTDGLLDHKRDLSFCWWGWNSFVGLLTSPPILTERLSAGHYRHLVTDEGYEQQNWPLSLKCDQSFV